MHYLSHQSLINICLHLNQHSLLNRQWRSQHHLAFVHQHTNSSCIDHLSKLKPNQIQKGSFRVAQDYEHSSTYMLPNLFVIFMMKVVRHLRQLLLTLTKDGFYL